MLLSQILSECPVENLHGGDLLALCNELKRLNLRQPVIDAVRNHYCQLGVEVLPDVLHSCPEEASSVVAEVFIQSVDWVGFDLKGGLSSHHWLMGCNLRDELVAVLKRYKPGSVLEDSDGHHWYRGAKMICTRHRFISCVGDDQEKYYEQKYLLTVPITPQSEVVLQPPQSWVELCAREGLCDEHLDALSCMQSAIARAQWKE